MRESTIDRFGRSHVVLSNSRDSSNKWVVRAARLVIDRLVLILWVLSTTVQYSTARLLIDRLVPPLAFVKVDARDPVRVRESVEREGRCVPSWA